MKRHVKRNGAILVIANDNTSGVLCETELLPKAYLPQLWPTVPARRTARHPSLRGQPAGKVKNSFAGRASRSLFLFRRPTAGFGVFPFT